MYRVLKKDLLGDKKKLIDNIIMKTEIFSLLCVSGMGLYNAPKVFLDSFKNSHKIYFTIIFGYIGDAE